jgi:hypothetical protein
MMLKEGLPELFNSPDGVELKPGEILKPVWVEVGPEGAYKGNGAFKDPGDAVFKIVGFARNDRERWFGRGFTIVRTPGMLNNQILHF